MLVTTVFQSVQYFLTSIQPTILGWKLVERRPTSTWLMRTVPEPIEEAPHRNDDFLCHCRTMRNCGVGLRIRPGGATIKVFTVLRKLFHAYLRGKIHCVGKLRTHGACVARHGSG